MRIAYIGVKGIPYGGGIEKVTEEIGSRIAQMGHEVVVYCDKAYCNRSGIYKGMMLKPLPSIRLPYLSKVSNALLATLHTLIENKLDVVHLHSVASLFAPLIKIVGFKTISHIHSFEWKKRKWNRLVRFILRLSDYFAVWFADRIVVVSDDLFKYFNDKHMRKVRLLHNGVSHSEYLAPDLVRQYGLCEDNYILYVGRLSREKGLICLVEAYRQVDTGKMLVLAGDFADDREFRDSLIDSIGGDKQIILAGYVDGKMKAELLSNAYCIVFPSGIEGSPMALLEAMSYGKCCVASDITEHLEIMNGFGYTFGTGDQDDLRDLLTRLLSQRNMVDRYKEDAKLHVVEKYNWNMITDSLENLYISLLPEKGE